MDQPKMPERIRFDRKKLKPPNRDILRYIAKSRRHAGKDKQRRSVARHTIGMPCPVMLLDAAGDPSGDEFMGVVNNLSTGGIALLHTERVEAEFFIVELDVRGLQPVLLMVEVLRGLWVQQFFEVAGRFVDRVSPIAATSS